MPTAEYDGAGAGQAAERDWKATGGGGVSGVVEAAASVVAKRLDGVGVEMTGDEEGAAYRDVPREVREG